MLDIITSAKFKKDAKKLTSQMLDELECVLQMLCEGKELLARYREHTLTGNCNGYKECHIRPDLLLI